MAARKIMPCGWRRTGKLQEHLAHYHGCGHPACKERLAEWNKLRAIAANGGIIVREVGQ